MGKERQLLMYEEIKNAYGLRPVWDAIGEIYLEFARICNKYRLRHYASGGTALGAVRHNGFIPWDDDIDIMLPRTDYEKFLKVARSELPSYLKIVNRHNTPEFHMLYSKIQDCRRDKVLEIERKTGITLSDGLFVDIYPMDGYPQGWKVFSTKFRLLLLDVLWRYKVMKIKDLSFRGKIAWCIGAGLALLMPKLLSESELMDAYDGILQEIPYEESEIVSDIGYLRNAFVQPRIKKSFLGNPTPHIFEDFTVMLPADIDGYCSNKFGVDYMQLPPEDKRISTHKSPVRCPWWIGPTSDDTARKEQL